MKKRLFLPLCLCCLLNMQAQDSDYISFSNIENYLGEKTKFTISNEGAQLNDESTSSTNTAILSFESNILDDATWETDVHLGFNPSAQNYVRFYLSSDKSGLSAQVNAYFVMIGYLTDEVSLYCQTGTTKAKIIDGTDKRLDTSTVDVSIKVTRSADGFWQLYSKLPTDSDFVKEGECTDLVHTTTNYAGYCVNYTSSNGKNVSFKNLKINGVSNKVTHTAEFADLVFSELMIKPSPSVTLPEEEYIEITNRTDKDLNLSDLYLCDESKKYTFPAVVLNANETAILCSQKNAELFSPYGKCITFSSFPALTDSGKLLWIEDSQSNVICQIRYDESWYNNAFKSNGGWSLECIDVNNLSNSSDNWEFSSDKRGGTPGESNSVSQTNADKQAPSFSGMKLLTNNSVQLNFSEPMDTNTLLSKDSYTISADISIQSLEAVKPENKSVIVTLASDLSQGTTEMSFTSLTDLAGNAIENAHCKITLASDAETDDVIVNEFLIGQKSGNQNFIELLNRSTKTIDLSDLYLCSRNNGEISAGNLLSKEQMLLFPQELAVVTTDIDKLRSQYNCPDTTVVAEVKSLAEFTTNGGNILLVKRNSEIVSELVYTADMCNQMTANTDIASLELTDFETGTWHVSTMGATPGTENSMEEAFTMDVTSDEQSSLPKEVTLVEKSFSPNGDDYKDVLQISCNFGEESGYIKIDIYTAKGALVKHLMGRTAFSEPTVYEWDGNSQHDMPCNVGLYIAYVEIQTDERGIVRYKLPFAITKD